MSTTERLAEVLTAHGLPEMAKKAREGYYDDFRSPLATPIIQLVRDLQAAKQHALAQRAVNGEFDATLEEAEEWYDREGRELWKKFP